MACELGDSNGLSCFSGLILQEGDPVGIYLSKDIYMHRSS